MSFSIDVHQFERMHGLEKQTDRTEKPQPELGLCEFAKLHAGGVLMRFAITLSVRAAILSSCFCLVLGSAAGRAFFAATRIFSAAAFASLAGAHACFRIFAFAAGHVPFGVFTMAARHLALAILTMTTGHVFADFGHLFATRACG
jgi:hypothetical protein